MPEPPEPTDKEMYPDEYFEMQPNESCVKCGRGYDEIDFDYQTCSRCGWDSENKQWTKPRQPSDRDYLNGEVNVSIGEWC